ncbi:MULTISPECIES: hypothetical protein [unclassified Streptomyces]|uniref:hypothetical protein n=1 Tax=unclassified Streptomyces TaxID=2593676 RepID=UPI0013313C71|nr:hypothetical protein [Streptomyces sp. Sge12]
MTPINPPIEGFHYDLPDCSEAWPTGMQTSWCPTECDLYCSNDCEGAWNSMQCRRKCDKDCMNNCLFVPCCTREEKCDYGVHRVRESCRLSYWERTRTSDWKATGWC